MSGSVNEAVSDGDRHLSELDELVGRDVLQRLQDHLSALAKVTVCICTVDGTPLTKPTWGSRFSELIGTSEAGRASFLSVMHDCARDSSPDPRHTCHEGMTVVPTPIIHDGHSLAILITGTRNPDAPSRAIVEDIARSFKIDADELARGTTQIDPYRGGAPEAIRDFARVLGDTIATLYGQALQIKRQLSDLQTVHELTQRLSGTQDLQEILDMAVRRIAEVMRVKACAIRLLNRDTGELVIKAVYNLSEEYLRKGPVILHQNSIDSAAFAGETVYIEDAVSDPRTRYPENARKEGIVSGLCVPMVYRGQSIGVLRVYTGERYRFSSSECSLLRSIASQAASAIITSRLRKEQHEAERVQRQVVAAGAIQKRMLPAKPPTHPGLEIGCVYDPTLEVGGDFYDFVELSEGRLGVCIADVVGKGLPAALMMSSVRSAMRAYAGRIDDVDRAVAEVNRHMCRDTLESEFATLVYGVFSADGRSVSYCNAGHLPPLLLRDDRFHELTAGGLVIGIRADATYDRGSAALQPGDVLTMVTDGVTEAIDFGDTQFGFDRLRESIRRHRSLDAGHLASQLLWDVRRFVGLADQSDDISIVVVKVR